jgi:hypothetical protein
MKKENTKKNKMESQKIHVKNLPKTKKWWQEYAFFIAILALCVSTYSAYLSRKEFIAAHRPYVYVSNRRDDKGTMDINTVIIRSLNAPAKIVSKKFYYMVVKTNENDEESYDIKYEQDFTRESTVYPSETTTAQLTVLYDFRKEILAADPNIKLRRRVRINYKELSSDRSYFFEGNWDYNRNYNVWENINLLGD